MLSPATRSKGKDEIWSCLLQSLNGRTTFVRMTRAAALSNLAMAKFIFCQLDGTAASLEIPLNLYRDVLHKRPTGHMDRPSTLIQFAVVSFAKYDRSKDQIEGARCEALLRQAPDLSSGESHENRIAMSMLQLRAVRQMDRRWNRSNEACTMEQNFGSGVKDQDPRVSSVALLKRYEQVGDVKIGRAHV